MNGRLVRNNIPLVFACGFFCFAQGCNSGDGIPTIQENIGLTAFKDCSELESYIEDTAVRHMRNRLDPALNRRDSVGFFAEDDLVSAESSNADIGNKVVNFTATTDFYTRTNTQVDGVDEADFVKTNGTQIFVLSGNRLQILKSWPADQMTRLSSIKIAGQPMEMFLEESKNRVSIISTIYTPVERDADEDVDQDDFRTEPVGVDCFAWGCGNAQVSTKLTVIDTATASAPQVMSEYFFPGRYQNARRVGAAIRVVLSEDVAWPKDVKWWLDSEDTFLGLDLFNDGSYQRLMDENEEFIRAQKLEQWVAKVRRKTVSGTETEFDLECSQFSAANGPIDLGFTTVATINLDEDTASRASIVAKTNEIYATTESLYLSSHHWWWWVESDQRDWTYFFKLDISKPKSSNFVSAGGVAGHLLNQFSMDEHEGHLRVATTVTTQLEEDDQEFGPTTITNRVSVLDGDLKLVGASKDVAEGERIYSARFVGEKGFIVTFRETDPLFTVDLKDPKNPKIIGELKVPGFSTYIHPLDENHLLTIGVHLPEPDAMGRVNFEQRSLKLSLFDVSDFAQPKEKFTHRVGSSSAFSEALHEHKAFNYFAEKKLLAIPFADWSWQFNGRDFWSEFQSEVRVFHVDVDNGFTSKGALSVNDIYAAQGNNSWTWYWDPWVRRSIMADDYVYAISSAGVRSAHVDATHTPLSTVTFIRSTD